MHTRILDSFMSRVRALILSALQIGVLLFCFACLIINICSAQEFHGKRLKHVINKNAGQNEFRSFIKEREYADSPYEIASPEAEQLLQFIEKTLASKYVGKSGSDWERTWAQEFIVYLRQGHGEYLRISESKSIVYSYFLNASLSGVWLSDMSGSQFKKLALGYNIEMVDKGILADGTGWILWGFGGLTHGQVVSGLSLITYFATGNSMQVNSTSLVDLSSGYTEDTLSEKSDSYLCGEGEDRIEGTAGQMLKREWRDINNDGQDELLVAVEEKDCRQPNQSSKKLERVFFVSRGKVSEKATEGLLHIP